MNAQLLPISPSETQGRSDSTSQLIKQWLFRFGIEHKEDVAPRLPLWLETFGGMDPAILESLFQRALKTCRFFPKISEILEHVDHTKETALAEAANLEWQRVLALRRTDWNPDMPGCGIRLERLSDRVQAACRASGVFRDFESPEQLHTWAKKRFIESYLAWEALEEDKFLLPNGELKNLISRCAEKLLPYSQQNHVPFGALHERGLRYAEQLKSERLEEPNMKRAIRAVAQGLTVRPSTHSIEEQKQILRDRGFKLE